MTYQRKNRGVCSLSTTVTLSEDGTIENVEVLGGCNGAPAGDLLTFEGHESTGRHRPHARDHLRQQAHLLPGPDRSGAGRGSGPVKLNTRLTPRTSCMGSAGHF